MSFQGIKNIISLLASQILNSLFIPFWLAQRIINRSRNIWVLGAWYGKRYSDNCRNLFEYINTYEPAITPIWLSKNKKDLIYIRNLGYKAYHARSLKGIIYSLRAKIIIFSSNKSDINKYFVNGAVLINLWHAASFKKVELGITTTKEYKLKLWFYKIFLPWLHPYKIDHTIVLSKYFTDETQNDFGVKNQDIFISGFPRNDNLYSKISSEIVRDIKLLFKDSKIIMYMPTFRDYDLAYNYFNDFKFTKFQEYLKKTNSIFLFKGHYASKTKCDFSQYDRIIDYDSFQSNQEMYLHIKEMDILITDYSSIFHDFLLLDKPIIFTPFDLPIYIKSGRELHYVYNKSVPGPICNNWDEVLDNLTLLSNGNLNYQKNNEYFKNMYHKYQDGNSSKRLFEEIKQRYL